MNSASTLVPKELQLPLQVAGDKKFF